jgi:hypothetical protein
MEIVSVQKWMVDILRVALWPEPGITRLSALAYHVVQLLFISYNILYVKENIMSFLQQTSHFGRTCA